MAFLFLTQILDWHCAELILTHVISNAQVNDFYYHCDGSHGSWSQQNTVSSKVKI